MQRFFSEPPAKFLAQKALKYKEHYKKPQNHPSNIEVA